MKSLGDFLKTFPDKWYLFTVFIIVIALYLYTRTDFSGQLLQTIVGAILGIIGVRRNQASTESGDVTMNTTVDEHPNKDNVAA
jgi:hypothetical protein